VFARVIADRYARAVLKSCPDLATIERVMNELDMVRNTYESIDSFKNFLTDPKLPAMLKSRVLRSAMGGKISSNTLDLLLLLIQKHRQNIIPEIAVRYAELVDQVRGVEKAEIIVAFPIPPDQRFSSRQVEISFQARPEILGGVIVRLGDRVIDGSLRRRFEDLRRAMLAARVPRTSGGTG
jgi:F-type H+-transporting ATPase subunit delta